MTFRTSFLRDLKKIKDQLLLERIAQAIESVEQAKDIQDLGRAGFGLPVFKALGTESEVAIQRRAAANFNPDVMAKRSHLLPFG